MANMIARLGVVLGIDTGEFVSGLKKASDKLDQFTEKAQTSAKVGAVAFAALITKSMDFADQIADVAKANDVAIDSVLKLTNALANSGGKAENAGKMLSGFTDFMDKAAQGSLQAQQTLQKTGVTLKDLAGLSTQDLFAKTVQGIAAIQDPLTRNAKAMEIFGKAAKGVDFPGLVDEIQRANSVSEQQAQAIQKMADAYDKLAEHGRQFQIMLATELGPAVNETADFFLKTSNVGSALRITFEALVGLAATLATALKLVALDLKVIFGQFEVFAAGGFAGWKKYKEQYEKEKESINQDLDKFITRLVTPVDFWGNRNAGGGRGFINPPMAKPTPVGRLTKQAVEPEEEKLRKLRAQSWGAYLQFLEQVNQETNSYAASLDQLAKGIDNEQEARKRAYDVEKQSIDLIKLEKSLTQEEMAFRKELIQLDYQRAEAVRKIEESYLDPDVKLRAIEKENELYARGLDLARQRLAVEKAKREGTFEEGFGQGFQDWVKKLPTELERGQAAFSTVMSNMESALERFVRTGKLSFKDLIRSMIQDLLLLQMKAQMSSIFSSLMGKLFGTGNVYGAGEFNQGMPGFGGAYADGGSIPGGRMSLVGERGPELFVPRSSGTIIPNNQLAGMGSTTNVTNNYINAIDVKSFEQRLLSSSNAVWAANAYAQKSLAVGRGRS